MTPITSRRVDALVESCRTPPTTLYTDGYCNIIITLFVDHRARLRGQTNAVVVVVASESYRGALEQYRLTPADNNNGVPADKGRRRARNVTKNTLKV